MYETIQIRTNARSTMLDITSEVQRCVSESQVRSGICIVYVPHTTAGITINEGADPDVTRDITERLSDLVPHRGGYHHTEGNADSHIKATLVGSSVTLLVEEGRLVLGTWQRVFFCEFDGPRNRKAFVKLLPSNP